VRFAELALFFGVVLGSGSVAHADALATRLGFAPRLEHVTAVPGLGVTVAGVGRTHALRLACSTLSVNAGEACEDGDVMTAVLAFRPDTGEAIAWRVEGVESLASLDVAPVEIDGDALPEIAILADTEQQNTRSLIVLDVDVRGLSSLLYRVYDVRDVQVGEDEVALRGVTASFLDIDGDGRAELRLAGEWDGDIARRAIGSRFSAEDEEDEAHGYYTFEEALDAHFYDYYTLDVLRGRFVRVLAPYRR
jgi:hypothetical protein